LKNPEGSSEKSSKNPLRIPECSKILQESWRIPKESLKIPKNLEKSRRIIQKSSKNPLRIPECSKILQESWGIPKESLTIPKNLQKNPQRILRKSPRIGVSNDDWIPRTDASATAIKPSRPEMKRRQSAPSLATNRNYITINNESLTRSYSHA